MFTLSPSNPIVGMGVVFDASGSSDPNGTIVNYLWDFGDTTSQINFLPSMVYVYLIPGTVTVTLTVFDNFGRTASTSTQLVISADTSSFLTALRLKTGENSAGSSIIDIAHGFAYFGLYSSPGVIVKIRLSNFTEVASITLPAGEDYLSSAAIDYTNQIAYFGTSTFPGIIVKINLSTFTQIGSISLNSGENEVYTALLDPIHGFAYFGLGGFPAEIVKVRLSDFTRTANLTLPTGQTQPEAGVIDPAEGYAYFGTYTSPGIIVKIRLSDFTEVGSLSLGQGQDYLSTATIDTGAGFAYFAALPAGGTQQSYATIVRLNTAGFNVHPTASFTFSPTNPTTGQQVSFDGSTSSDPGGFIVSYKWTFGDGFNSTFGPFTQHTYSNPGNYTIVLTIVDNGGLTSVATHTITVTSKPPDIPLLVQFTFFPSNPQQGATVSFDASQSRDPDGFSVSYAWRFGV